MEQTVKTAFERVQTARHPERPYTLDLVSTIFEDFVELHGDRRFADDPAMVCGFAKLGGFEIAIIGQQKGRDLNQRRHRNFGMPKPEGYRKALRVMQLAEKFKRPIITFVDTPGAYPGIDAEERGQAEAIAFNLREMASLKVPTIVVILGEGGSGGALAIGVGDRVLMLENAVYSVITPEGCAAILWKDASKSSQAAECLRLTAQDLQKFGLVDEVILEPHDWKYNAAESISEKDREKSIDQVSENLKDSILKQLKDLSKLSNGQRMNLRYQKFRKMGDFEVDG
jgi:acetyl-CoA carboxylase carboxyl transferase subunit alpha